MAQLNIHLNADLEENLARLVRLKGLRSKSDAVRIAVKEAVERETRMRTTVDFGQWIGLALKAPINRKPRFQTDDDVWGEERGR